MRNYSLKEKSKEWHICCFFGIIALIICSVCLVEFKTGHAKTKEDISTGRIINVVYDDSGSMVRSHGTFIPRWSQAKYSLEVFAAMLGSKDVMNVYPMSLEGKRGFTLTGKDSKRVKTVHDMNGEYRNTPFKTVTSAGESLLKDSSNSEKWLVIITDGEFDDGSTPMSKVKETLDSYVKKGVKIAFLAIGDDVSLPKGDPSRGFYTEKAEDGIDVLKKVTNIANQIFSHMVLPNENISVSGKKYKLSFDIPTDQIIVFVQGDKVSIGDINKDGTTISATEVENVKYSDTIPANSQYKDAVIDTSLKGVVASFEAGIDPFPEGTYEISVSGAETIEFYYKPGVVVNAELLYKGQTVRQDEVLYVGDYDVTMNFVNPLTGLSVTSKLLKDAEFSLEVDNNDNIFDIDGTRGSIHLDEGEVWLTATAVLPGQVILKDQKNYEVIPEPKGLSLEVQVPKESYESREIAEGVEPLTLIVKDEKENRYLTEEEWDITEISLADKGGIKWVITKGDKVSTWKLLPTSADGTFMSIQAGELPFDVSAGYHIGNLYAHGTGDFTLNIIPYTGSKLVLEADSRSKTYSMDNLEKEGGIKITILSEDDDTGEVNVLTEEMLKNLKFEAVLQEDKKLVLSVEPDSGGSFILYPKYYEDALHTDEGQYIVVCKAQTTEGEKYYSGEIQVEMIIGELSFAEWLRLNSCKLIIAGLILFILIGYIKKNRIPPRKKLNPHNSYMHKAGGKKKLKKYFWSVVIPYRDERGLAWSNDTGFKCNIPNLKIRAVSKNTFKIINKNINVKSLEVDGEKFDTIMDLKKKKFSYSAKFTYIDPAAHKKYGSFEFK